MNSAGGSKTAGASPTQLAPASGPGTRGAPGPLFLSGYLTSAFSCPRRRDRRLLLQRGGGELAAAVSQRLALRLLDAREMLCGFLAAAEPRQRAGERVSRLAVGPHAWRQPAGRVESAERVGETAAIGIHPAQRDLPLDDD